LQFFAGLEADSLAGLNVDFLARPRVTPDARLAALDFEDTKSAKLDSLPSHESALHGIKNCLNGHFRLRLGNSGSIQDFSNEIELDHGILLKIQYLW
jgi:hypothetical protein